MLMAFPCNGCGACCRHIGNVVRMARALEVAGGHLIEGIVNFPYRFDDEGTCEKYDPAIGCTIYETRPSICRVDEQFDRHYYKEMSYDDYMAHTKAACNDLMNLYDSDKPRF